MSLSSSVDWAAPIRKTPAKGGGEFLLNDARLFERFVGAVFCNGAQALGGEGNSDGAVELRHKDALFLEVGVLTHIAAGVKFGRADAIAVAAYNLGAFLGYGADFCHKKIQGGPLDSVMVS